MNQYNILYEHLAQQDQTHLLKHWAELSNQQQDHLYNQIINIDLNEIKQINTNSKQNDHFIKQINFAKQEPNSQIYSITNRDSLAQYEQDGLRLISNNSLAVITLAGGLNKRLSVSYPKGLYSVDLLSNKSLFQIHAERIIRVKQLANRMNLNNSVQIPWYIMTSEQTNSLTIEFFKENNYFSLNENDVIFFKQNSIPCFCNGRLILENKFTIKMVPNGSGGLYEALVQNNILNDMQQRNIQFVHIYGIENLLLKVADPIFTGFCFNNNIKCATKIVTKTRYNEPMNGLAFTKDQLNIFDFSLNSNLSTQILFDTNKSESIFNLGDIGCYFMEYHELKSQCKIDSNYFQFETRFTVLNDKGAEEKQRCVYFEKLLTQSFNDLKLLKVERCEEYSPLEYMFYKNLYHTKTSCKKDLIDLHFSWLIRAGAKFHYPDTNEMICSSNCDLQNLCEISPLISYSGEDLEMYVKNKCFEPPLVLELDTETNMVTFNGLDFDDFNKAYPTLI